jgi:hypothetical protein
LASAGGGNGAGMGTGSGGGMGRAAGTDTGPGYGGNTGGGVYQVGGRISAPVVVHSVEAEFSDEARRAKYQGVCLISLIVDAQGIRRTSALRGRWAWGWTRRPSKPSAIQIQAGHEGRQDACAGDDHDRGRFPALLTAI